MMSNNDNKNMAFLKSELDLFNNAAVQLAIDSSAFLEVHPISSISEKTPIEFYIAGNGEHYLDLSHTILQLQVKILKKNGGDLVAADHVAPINYLLNTLFSECSVFLNDKQIASQANYGYRAFLESLLFSSKSSQETMYGASLFFKDTAGHHDALTSSAGGVVTNSSNTGYLSRYDACKNSKLMDLIGPLHFDLATQPKLLINGVNIRIKLERNKDIFSLMAQDDAYKIVLQSASLYVRKVTVAPSIMIAHEKALEKGVIKMPIRRIEVKTFSLSAGLQSSTIANAFIGQLPTRIILGFVSNRAYNGNSKKNPFKFSHYNLNYLTILNDGLMIPAKPFQPHFDNDLYARCYLSLFTDLNRYHNFQNIPISYKEYKEGYTFYAVDLTPDLAANESHISIAKTGNIALDIKFSTPLPETVTLVAYTEYRNVIEIDKTRSIFTDY